jgi:hypothetical protein
LRFQRASHWIHNCIENHPLCVTPLQLLPTSVLDVGPNTDEYYCKLVEPKSHYAEYVTLSHCWGQYQNLTSITYKANLQGRLEVVCISSLPRTFQDAISYTRRLGISYLWIDSLCILQDDKDDWERECVMMGTIYRNSFLTLAATAAEDGSRGLFCERQHIWDARIHTS